MEQFDQGATSKIGEIRVQNRLEINERRRKKVHDLLSIKRKWVTNEWKDPAITASRVVELSKQLKKSKQVNILKILSEAFTLGDDYINAFFSVDGALYALVGCLTGNDTNLQLASILCLINLGSGNHKTTFSCIKAAAVYLLVYLENSNCELQELCVWALGNFAGDCSSCSQLLTKQGFVPAVKKLLSSENEKVKYSAYFALACYTYTRRNQIDEELLTHETLSLISHPLAASCDQDTMAESASIIFHLTCSGKNDQNLLSSGVIATVLSRLDDKLRNQIEAVTVITPLVRALANLCSGDASIVTYCVTKPEFKSAVHLLMTSRYHHIVKESLWLLSNILGCPEGLLILQDSKILSRIADLSESIGPISLQSLVCLCNVSAIPSQHCKMLVMEISIFTKIQRLLERNDIETVRGCLTLLALVVENSGISKEELMVKAKECMFRVDFLKGHEDEEIAKLALCVSQMLN